MDRPGMDKSLLVIRITTAKPDHFDCESEGDIVRKGEIIV